MPICPLTNKYRLASSVHSWELQERTNRKHRKTGELVEVWKAIKWYRSADIALDAAYEHCLRVSDTEDIRKAIRETQSLLASVRKALNSEQGGKSGGE